MKNRLLPLLALPILLGACNSTTSQSAFVDTSPAVLVGTLDTKWGQLPYYNGTGHRLKLGGVPNPRLFSSNGQTKVHLLVDADGRVREVDIAESNMNPASQRATAAMYKKARYSMKLSPTDPAPYVIEVTHNVHVEDHSRPGFIDTSSLASQGPQPDYSGPPPATYSSSTSSP
jgi:hypothetical protein